jgi:hypothetical protein
MKNLLTALFLSLIAITSSAQKVEVKTDDFTGEKVITTDYLKIYQGGATAKNQTRVRLRHENGEDYIEYRIFTDAIASCRKGLKMLIKTNDGIVETTNTELAVSEPGAWSAKPINSNLGIYIICSFSPSDLQGKTIQKIRFNLTDGYLDLDIKDKDAAKFKQLLAEFLNAL